MRAEVNGRRRERSKATGQWPACGSGAFLVAAFDALAQEYDRANRAIAELNHGQTGLFDPTRVVLNENLYGVDLNAESVEITRLSLWLKTASRGTPADALSTVSRASCGALVDAPEAPGGAASQVVIPRAATRWRVQAASRPRGAEIGFDAVRIRLAGKLAGPSQVSTKFVEGRRGARTPREGMWPTDGAILGDCRSLT